MGILPILLGAWAGLGVIFAAAWLVQRRTRDAAIVDVVWVAAFGLTAIYYALVLDLESRAGWFVVLCVVAWSTRLGGHLLFTRLLSGRPEDGRYAAMRRDKGERFQSWLFGFFQAQALSVVLLSVSILGVLLDPPTSKLALTLGGLCFAAAIVGEAIADRQLERFRSNSLNRGRVCRSGLWRYSRHPNYFFEWLHWLAYPILASFGDYAWLTWFAPPVMLYLMLAVTGIPPTEAQAVRSRGDAYREYQRTTSAFFPWFPRA